TQSPSRITSRRFLIWRSPSVIPGSFELGGRIPSFKNANWQNTKKVSRCKPWPIHLFADRQYGAHRGKTFGQYRCIPGLSGRPSPAALRRATKQPAGHDDNSVLLAQPCERDDLVAVRTDRSERTLGAVGKDVRKLLSQRKKLARQGEFDAAVWPCARKRTPIRRLADRVERGCPRGEVDRSPVVGIHQRQVPEFGALIEIGDARHGRLQD